VKTPVFCKGGPKDQQVLPADSEDGTYLIFNESMPWAYYRLTDVEVFDAQLGAVHVADYIGEHPQ
jgi:hypothetical protein